VSFEITETEQPTLEFSEILDPFLAEKRLSLSETLFELALQIQVHLHAFRNGQIG